MQIGVERTVENVEYLEYGGNLQEELGEIGKLISESEELELSGTSTRRCGVFLTIYCC